MASIKYWKETDFTIVNGITNTFPLDPRSNLVQVINRKDGGGGNVFFDNRQTVSTSNYAIKVEQGKTGNIVRPYPLQNLYLITDAASTINVTVIEVMVEDLGVVFNASQVLQIQGAVTVNQPVNINDLNTEVAEGAANPSKAFLMAATDGTNAHYLQVDASKNLKVLVNGALPAGSAKIGAFVIQDSASSNQANISAFHNTDHQTFSGTTYGLMTGGVAQLLTIDGALDRQRETSIDGIPSQGIATGTQQLASPFSTTSTTAVSASTTVAVTPAAMSGTSRGSAWSIQVGSSVTVDTGANKETVYVTAVTATTFTATFTKAHSGTWTIAGNVYNQAKDATVADGSIGAGFSANATYLLNGNLNAAAGGWEAERSAAGEMDGASGTGTAVAAEYEFNGVTFDRARNIQGKGVATGTISSGGGVGSSSITFSAAPTGLQPGSVLILTGGTTEQVLVSQTYVAGTNPVTLQSNIANSGHTGAQWDIFAVLGPGLTGFYPDGIGLEEEAVYDPATGLFYLERSATQDNVAPQNVVIENPGYLNAAGNIDRARGVVGVMATPYSGTQTAAITTATTTTVKSGIAMLGTISNAANATTGVITVYDNTSAAGKLLWVGTLTAGQVVPLGLPCALGITVVTAGANAIVVSFA